MPTLSKPAMFFPEHVINQQDMIDVIENLYPYHPKKEIAFKMIKNMQVEKRHIIRPLKEITEHSGYAHRSIIYEDEARKASVLVANEAIRNAQLSPTDIDMVIVTSCTGFMMPSLTAHLINTLNLRNNVVQLPIAQMGCAGGACAINRSYDYCKAVKNANVLIVTVELSSLCFQPSDDKLSNFISNALFGDSAAAVVMRGDDKTVGFKIENTTSLFLKNTEDYICYDVKETGFHFKLNKNVMHSIEHVAPAIKNIAMETYQTNISDFDFCIFHTGGKKILDELVNWLYLPESKVAHSRDCLKNAGNTSSVAVIDVLERWFSNQLNNLSKGVMAGFGPGFTAEIAVGSWQN